MSKKQPDRAGAVRFYGRRQGHALRPGRRELVEAILPKIQITVPADLGTIDLPALFGEEKRAYWIEIGFGSGEHIATMAEAYPDLGFLGCEPFINGVAALVSAINDKGLSNIRIFSDDVRLLLPHLPSDSFQRIYLPFADPWPKKRHNRRRMIQTEMVDTFARLLMDLGEFRFASDHMGYVRWALEIIGANQGFEWTARGPADWRTRPVDSIETRYEAKARAKGAPCVHLCYRRRIRGAD